MNGEMQGQWRRNEQRRQLNRQPEAPAYSRRRGLNRPAGRQRTRLRWPERNGMGEARRAAYPAIVSFFMVADTVWRNLCQPFQPSLVIQFICSDRR